MIPHRSDRVLGALALLFSLTLLFLWIPADIETGVIETFRRRSTIGDAMLPTMLGIAIGLVGLWLLLFPHPRAGVSGADAEARATGLGLSDLRYLGWLTMVITLSLLAMRWSGPIAAAFFDGAAGGYRPLRDSIPWKYLGFLIGGWWMLASLLVRLNGGVRFRWLALALVAVVALMLLIDLPFDDLLLPPNGDV